MAVARLFFYYFFQFFAYLFRIIAVMSYTMSEMFLTVSKGIVPPHVIRGNRAMARIGIDSNTRSIWNKTPRVVTDTGNQISKHPTAYREMPKPIGAYKTDGSLFKPSDFVDPKDVPF